MPENIVGLHESGDWGDIDSIAEDSEIRVERLGRRKRSTHGRACWRSGAGDRSNQRRGEWKTGGVLHGNPKDTGSHAGRRTWSAACLADNLLQAVSHLEPAPETPLPPKPLTRLRKLCLALPEAHEVEAWGEPTFRVRNKLFAMYADAGNHHGDGRAAVWCKAGPGTQALMAKAAPARFFVPPYVGPSGWIGVWLDGSVDWTELAELLRDSYRLVAPKRLGALLDV